MRGFVLLLLLTAAAGVEAAQERLELRRMTLELPGPPARVLPVDLDADGRRDLVIVVAYTEIEPISEARLENMVQMMRVIPALYDRRQAWAYRAVDGGGYEVLGPPLDLPLSVLHMEVGPAGTALVCLTDEGIGRVRLDAAAEGGPRLVIEPLVASPSVLAHTRRFYADLSLVHDLDGDDRADMLLPTRAGLAVHLATEAGLAAVPAAILPWPEGLTDEPDPRRRRFVLPTVTEVNGDELPDLVFDAPRPDHEELEVWLGQGQGRFAPLRRESRDCHDRGSDLRLAGAAPGSFPWPANVAALRDLDGDGRAEAVLRIERARGDSWRKEMKDAKRPQYEYRFRALDAALDVEREPYFRMDVVGHTMEDSFDDDDGGSPFRLDQFVDLDGDGREDLVTVTLEFSVFQVIKILATKKIGIGFNFHVYAQQPDGSFREVPDLDLSEKLKFDLNNLEVGRFAQFAGDFDGDGRRDFVHLGRGKDVTVHRGQPGCVYPAHPDLVIPLEEEPPSLDLVRIEDLDGDGRADIRITRPRESNDPDLSAPARLDLHLSGAAR